MILKRYLFGFSFTGFGITDNNAEHWSVYMVYCSQQE